MIAAEGDRSRRPSPARTASSSRCMVLDWSNNERNEVFRRRLAERLAVSSALGSSAEQIDKYLTSAIHETAAETGCSRRWKPPKPWWTPAVSAARDRAHFWHRLWTETGRHRQTTVHDGFRAARRAYRCVRVQAARSQQDSGARLLSMLRRDRKLKAFWRRVEHTRRGSVGSRSTLTAANPGPARDVTAEDVARLVPELNCDASPGPDGVTAEHLMYGSSPALFQVLASLLTACLE